MGLIDTILRRKKADPRSRRDVLLANGRITDGVIIDIETNGAGEEVVVFSYTLNGVDFEASELLTTEQKNDPSKYAPGAKVGIRYDQRNQGNSVVE